MNSVLDSSSGSATICHLIHFQRRLWRLCACVCTYTLPTSPIHHFNRLVPTSSQVPFLSQELAFDTSSFCFRFPWFSLAYCGGRQGKGCMSWNWREFPQKLNTSLFSYLACLSEVLDFQIFLTFPGSYECGMHGFLLQKQQETEQV